MEQFDPTSQKPEEPDYLFVANKERYEVLTDQLTDLGLTSKIYKHSQDPDRQVLVLVFFNDNVLNKEAED